MRGLMSSVYERQLPMTGWGENGQNRLASSTVFVAGLGGLGCPAAVYLSLAGVGRIVACDADDIEQSNLNRQFLYRVTDIGRRKAAIAAERLREMNPRVEVISVDVELDRENAAELVSGADVVLDCLDNLETRIALSRACMDAGMPLIHAAVADLTGYLSFFDPPRTACLECFQTAKPAAVEPAIPGCTAGALGSLQAMEALKHLLGLGEVLAGRLLIMEGMPPSFDVVALEKDPDCPACGG